MSCTCNKKFSWNFQRISNGQDRLREKQMLLPLLLTACSNCFCDKILFPPSRREKEGDGQYQRAYLNCGIHEGWL